VVFDTGRSETRGRANRTDALPDHFDRTKRGTVDVPEGSTVVLGSDGFFGSFSNTHAIREWLDSRRVGDAVDDLHVRLAQTIGDDDISAVILRIDVESLP
jgi:serine/threonine protein phosphatase PrpC